MSGCPSGCWPPISIPTTILSAHFGGATWTPRPASNRVKQTIKRKIGYRKLPVSHRRSLMTAPSATTVEQANEQFELREIGEVAVRGRSQTVHLYEVLGKPRDIPAQRKRADVSLLVLAQAVDLVAPRRILP